MKHWVEAGSLGKAKLGKRTLSIGLEFEVLKLKSQSQQGLECPISSAPLDNKLKILCRFAMDRRVLANATGDRRKRRLEILLGRELEKMK
ncbi:hypothetical protein V6N13_117513 [Hibiscus sabdariffa]